jgi:ketol-acid reductoisomerase
MSATKNEMRKILKEIQSGKFARQWIEENKSGQKREVSQAPQAGHGPPDREGRRKLRARMPWLNDRRA